MFKYTLLFVHLYYLPVKFLLHIFFFLCSVRLLPDAIGSPAAAKLGAGTLGGAKTVKITLCALYFLDQVFLGVFPSIV